MANFVVTAIGTDRPGLVAALEAEGVLKLSAIALEPSDSAPADVTGAEVLHIFVLGHDRPGIVSEVASALASLGVSIESLQTLTKDAPMGDGVLFEADADLRVPAGVTELAIREAIEALAHDLVVDLDALEFLDEA